MNDPIKGPATTPRATFIPPQPDDFIVRPYTVVVDSREQAPYTFTGFAADAKDKRRSLLIKTVVAGLPTGDYSILGCEHEIAIERKSLADLYSTLGQGRERFEREFERLNQLKIAEIVVEASLTDILTRPEHSRLNPKVPYRTMISWKQKYRNVHWNFCCSRRLAEKTTWRILDKYWERRMEEEKAAIKAAKAGIAK